MYGDSRTHQERIAEAERREEHDIWCEDMVLRIVTNSEEDDDFYEKSYQQIALELSRPSKHPSISRHIGLLDALKTFGRTSPILLAGIYLMVRKALVDAAIDTGTVERLERQRAEEQDEIEKWAPIRHRVDEWLKTNPKLTRVDTRALNALLAKRIDPSTAHNLSSETLMDLPNIGAKAADRIKSGMFADIQ